MTTNRKYIFDWDAAIGDMNNARPSLGPTTRVEVYRLFQYTLRDVLELRYGAEECDTVFREAGALAGKHFFERFCKNVTSLNDLLGQLQELLKALGIGLLRLEKADPEAMRLILTVSEDLDCSGLPDSGDVVCVYDEGLIRGILEAYTGRIFSVKEIDCWASGDRTCRFEAILEQ